MGHINLVSPVYHVGFIPILSKILTCVCHKCGMIMADESDLKFREALRVKHPQERLRKIAIVCKTKRTCKHEVQNAKEENTPDRGCGAPHPDILRAGLNFKVKYPPAKEDDDAEGQNPDMVGEREMFADEALDILSRISNEDCEKLGMC
jgi:DNA-directed RNA polymerase II subunit RPB1